MIPERLRNRKQNVSFNMDHLIVFFYFLILGKQITQITIIF